MSIKTLDSRQTYLKHIKTVVLPVTRPASTQTTSYTVGVNLSDDDDFVPLCIGYYTDANGRTFPCKGITFFNTFPNPFSPITVELSAAIGGVIIRVVGETSDAVTHEVDVTLYFFAASLLDEV